MGDAHAGYYGGSIFENMAVFNRKHFASFATLLRCRFDEALPRFPDGLVDLLHIDGLHTYEAVREDFQSWLPKLSSRAVVLFHDIAIRAHDYEVWRLWQELGSRYPHFSFKHSAGLGVLAVGPQASPLVLELCRLEDRPEGDVIRDRFSRASELARESGKAELEHQAALALNELIGTATNIALGCNAFQSSAFDGASMTPGAAVNGLRTGGFAFHTAAEPNPWWMVDLGRASRFDFVAIFNRMDPDCAHRARNLVLLASIDGETWLELYRANGQIFGGTDGKPLIVACDDTLARFVRIRLDDINFLHLDQVEIYRR
jgi:hypothetical protein